MRFLSDDIPTWVPKGTIGLVKYVSDVPRVVVDFERTDKPEKSAWRHIDLQTRLECIELADA